MHTVFSEIAPEFSPPDLIERQALATERFIEVTAELLKIGVPLCNNCALSYITFTERSQSTKRSNKLQCRKESLQKATLEYRELLRRIESRIQESHDTTTPDDSHGLSPSPTSSLVPALSGFEESMLTQRPFDSPELAIAYKALTEEEALLEAELNELFAEREELVETAGILAAERRAVEEGERIVQRAAQDLQAMMADLSQAHGGIRLQTRDAYSALHNLVAASPITDLFPIELKGTVPTISGFSLGRTPTDPVDWAEISAAFGQVALLLDTTRRRYNHTIPRLQVLPRGGVSHIVRTANGKSVVLNLFRGERVRLNILGKQSPFDAAMEALLECLQSIYTMLCSNDPRIQEGWAAIDTTNYTIGGYSVKYTQEKEVDWTCAMRSLLFNCKKVLICSIQRND